jgi:hypothetical protein
MNRVLLLLTVAFALQGCIQTIAVRTMGGILDNGFQAFNEESDLQLAHEALASNLKLIEALIKCDPENEQFLMFAAQGYNATRWPLQRMTVSSGRACFIFGQRNTAFEF